MNYADPIVVEQFKNLPQKLKDVLFSEDTTDIIFAIGKENKLTVFQMEELADEAGLVVLGIKTTEDFAKNIAQRLATSAEKAAPIARATMEKIFNPILGDLRALVKPSARIEIPKTITIQKPVESPKPAEIKKTPTLLAPKAPPVVVTQPIRVQPVPKPVEPMVVQTPKPTEQPKITPVVPRPTVPKPIVEPQVFAKPIVDPYREPLDSKDPASVLPSPTKISEENLGGRAAKPKIVNWEDILKNKTKEPASHPDAKIALEKAMSDSPSPTKTAESSLNMEASKQAPPKVSQLGGPASPSLGGQAKYPGVKDPYREPLD